jgi:F-type H+-transporting ATPase subunit b
MPGTICGRRDRNVIHSRRPPIFRAFAYFPWARICSSGPLPRRIMLKRIAFFLVILTALACPLHAAEAPAVAAEQAKTTTVESAPVAEKEHGLIEIDYASAIWTLVIFLILLGLLYKGAWKNVLAGLKGREERIRNDIAQAEAARAKAEASLADYNAKLADAEARAREILAKATTDAVALAERIKTEADKAARDRAERAARDIEEARDQALRGIYEQAAELSTTIAEKILRRNLNANDQRDLVRQSLDEIQSVNRG